MPERLAVIGGSGLNHMNGLELLEEGPVETPYGDPSGPVRRMRLEGRELLFLPRHGPGHRIPPHAINYRANICALKKLGATQVLSVSAVGSLRPELAPGDLVVVDQFVDLTKRRRSTFFEDGIVAHVSMADPVCAPLRRQLHAVTARALRSISEDERPRLHDGGTYVCIEGPQFSSRAESELYRRWGLDVIGMTNMPEAKLAREAELSYATLALVTDYDCWHESEAAVEVEAVVATLKRTIRHAERAIRGLLAELEPSGQRSARRALASAVITPPGARPAAAQERLAWLLDAPGNPRPSTP
ncbi:MAG: S-methyl-5'-thioadenosine phosphorylase [Myxococcota bacterium]